MTAAMRGLSAGLILIAAPVAHHTLVCACRVALLLAERGLPDIGEREQLARALNDLCGPSRSLSRTAVRFRRT